MAVIWISSKDGLLHTAKLANGIYLSVGCDLMHTGSERWWAAFNGDCLALTFPAIADAKAIAIRAATRQIILAAETLEIVWADKR